METKIGKIKLDNPFMNASGVYCASEDELNFLNNIETSAIITKSCTIEKRIGNPLPRYYDSDTLSINSSGLPNNGYEFYYDFAKNTKLNKPYIVSVSGLCEKDNLDIIKKLSENKYISGIELNLSCPNVIGKSQIGYDFESVNNLLTKVNNIISKYINFGLKMPPYFDMNHFEIVSNIINRYDVDTITCINSLGNGLVIDSIKECPVIAPKNGFGGIGGTVIKPIALANVRKFYELTNCDIIGCGGISTCQDAFEHILCGASAVQIGTAFYKNKYVFNKIVNNFAPFIKDKNYNKINEFKGQIKNININI